MELRIVSSSYNWLIGGPGTPAGVYEPTFQYGEIQYAGPDGTFAASGQFGFGLAVPNPSGTNGPVLLLGSGTSGAPATAAIIQDQAFDATTNGNNLIITSGETQASGTANGGYLLGIGGGSYGGTGGTATWQGGTSLNGTGGEAILAGGNATAGGIPGDAFVIGGAGSAPGAGANVHLIMTLANSISGDVRIRCNSTILIQFQQHGEIYLTASGTGAGLAGQPLVSGGVGAAAKWLTGFTGTITTAKLTTAQGSMTFSSGLLVSQVQAT
jgi:hypothetical protein